VVLVRLLSADAPVSDLPEDFHGPRCERCHMIVDNSELLGEWEKNSSATNDAGGVVAPSNKALAQPV
jgi:hypothetical protein